MQVNYMKDYVLPKTKSPIHGILLWIWIDS